MENEKKSFKYILKWSGRLDSEIVQLAFAYCKKQIPICKDVCEFIDHQRYLELIASEQIAGPTKHWGINQFQVGMIALSTYINDYPMSWENLDMCYKDFIAGYEACEKKYQFLRDWDEALEYEKLRLNFLTRKSRTITIPINHRNITYEDIIYHGNVPDYQVFIRDRKNNTSALTITTRCTGAEFEYIIYMICNDCNIQMPEMEFNPLLKETREKFSKMKHKLAKVQR